MSSSWMDNFNQESSAGRFLCASRHRQASVSSAGGGDWTSVRRGRPQRRGRRRATGCSDARVDGLVGAPPPPRHVLLARIVNGNEEKIQSFFDKNKVNVVGITKVSHKDAKYSSYKISLNKSDLDTVLQDSFWPRGVVCEAWREPRRGMKNSYKENELTSTFRRDNNVENFINHDR